MQVTQITFIAKNAKCVSIKPKRYLINTNCTFEALTAANELLQKEKHFELYRALPALIMEVHDA